MYSDDRGNALETSGPRFGLSFTCSLCLTYRFLKLQPEGILHSTKPPYAKQQHHEVGARFVQQSTVLVSLPVLTCHCDMNCKAV